VKGEKRKPSLLFASFLPIERERERERMCEERNEKEKKICPHLVALNLSSSSS
jgi:hypothetical protein